ncbi:MAG: hypothetical protein HZA17_00425 [Nitrospirae bacterium]|nr:hypothetical protein [Nitrospirota bacterium]
MKDRCVPLPQSIMDELKAQLEYVKDIHQKDLDAGYAGTFPDNLLEKKYRNAPKELVWQWFFPAKVLTFVPEEKKYRRYHLHESHVQKALMWAVRKAKLTKKASERSENERQWYLRAIPVFLMVDWGTISRLDIIRCFRYSETRRKRG